MEEKEIDDGDSPQSKSDRKESIEDTGDQKLCPGFGIRGSKDRCEAQESRKQIYRPTAVFVGQRDPYPRRDSIDGNGDGSR